LVVYNVCFIVIINKKIIIIKPFDYEPSLNKFTNYNQSTYDCTKINFLVWVFNKCFDKLYVISKLNCPCL